MPARHIARFFAAIFAGTLILRLCHSGLLWPDEDYHLAAAMQVLRGKVLYRDYWYDKPPLNAWLYAAIGAPTGPLLRIFDAVWIAAICALVFRAAREMFGETEAFIASGLAAFFLNFDLPGAIIPIAPDFFMALPHVLVLLFVWRRRPFAAGLAAGIAFLFNPKAIFVLLAAGVFLLTSLPLLLAGFVIPVVVAVVILASQGALVPHIDQVWKWGALYARVPPAASTLSDGVKRTLDWFGFHFALLAGGVVAMKNKSRATRMLAVWCAIAFAAVALGGRFSGRYFLELLPILAILAGAGLAAVIASRNRIAIALAAIALAVPLVRFGGRYVVLARDAIAGTETEWPDADLDRDSRDVAAWLQAHSRPGDRLFIWGYRPDIAAWSRMSAGSRFGDSQPLTGVPADRHLQESKSLDAVMADANRRVLATEHPVFVVDGLSRLNPNLAPSAFPETRAWLENYELVTSTRLSAIYRIKQPAR